MGEQLVEKYSYSIAAEYFYKQYVAWIINNTLTVTGSEESVLSPMSADSIFHHEQNGTWIN